MSVIASAPFYASATFWAAAAVFAAIFMGIGAMWATMRASNPKRRIAYWFQDTPLLQGHQSLDGSLEMRRNGTVLGDPRLVRIQLRNTSRRDVASASFDQGEPFRVDLDTPILDVLGVETQPATAQPPPATPDGAELRIGPGRIGRGSQVTYLLLIDGPPSYACRHALIDVKVVEADDLDYDPRAARLVALIAMTVVAFAATLFADKLIN
jgi:hypothetical protein